MQLRLQQTVEGLSVVAISYYTIGILTYAAQAAAAADLLGGLSTEMATGNILFSFSFSFYSQFISLSLNR